MKFSLSYIPLIILLIILLSGCVYYLYQCKVTLGQILSILKGQKLLSNLKERPIEELKELLYINQTLEDFEQCAEIRDEIHRREGLSED